MRVSNWGRYPVVDATVVELTGVSEDDARTILGLPSFVPRGMGRCYGDSALGDTLVSTLGCNRVRAFDDVTGVIECDAGMTLVQLLKLVVPRGWFPPVTPGTKFVTLGGALASDVHGKNHHIEGSLAKHVLGIDLLMPDGSVSSCSASTRSDLFWATVGGMGLTGIICSIRLQLKRIANQFIRQRAIKARTLDEVLTLFATHSHSTYSVAWIDTLRQGRELGRSVLLLGEHADVNETPQGGISERRGLSLAVPVDFPSFTLNKWTIGAFNMLFYHKHFRQDQTSVVRFAPYFYPLDAIRDWNRIYGANGFTQYQFAVPHAGGSTAIRACLNACNTAGFSSFLSVLKAFGPGNEGLLSFPIEGLTLTLDFPIRAGLFTLLDRLDDIVADHGGRVYLTKDVRLPRVMFDRMYSNADAFRALRERIDPNRRLRSLQSCRLEI